MRIFYILILIALLMAEYAEGQQSKSGTIYRGEQLYYSCTDLSVGYIVDKKYQKFTTTLAFNNIIFKRAGAFTMVELNRETPAVVMGPTLTIYDFAYVWGGIDFVTSRGMFARHGFKHARKDLGIGFYPFKWMVVKLAHSFNAGSRMEIGIRVPLEIEPGYQRLRSR